MYENATETGKSMFKNNAKSTTCQSHTYVTMSCKVGCYITDRRAIERAVRFDVSHKRRFVILIFFVVDVTEITKHANKMWQRGYTGELLMCYNCICACLSFRFSCRLWDLMSCLFDDVCIFLFLRYIVHFKDCELSKSCIEIRH